MLTVFVGFIPWIGFWVLGGLEHPALAEAWGLVAALGLVVRDLRRGQVTAMGVTGAGFFALHAALSAVLGAAALAPWSALLSNGTLGAMAWGTLAAGTPFTAQYARLDWPREYWEAPLFVRINAFLTGTWALIFTVNAGFGLVSLARPEAQLWLVKILPQVAIALGVAASVLGPRWYPRRWAAREIAAREPYPWPPPVFSARGREVGDGEQDVIIVGAGIGGLTAGALLANRGLRVLVLEQHYLAGGFCTSWPRIVRVGAERFRYVFDAGVHDVSGLGPRGPVRHLLRELRLEDRLDWQRMRHEYILPGMRLQVPDGARAFVAALVQRFPGEGQAIEAFFAVMEAVYRELYADAHQTGGVPIPPATVDALLAYPAAHPHAFRWMGVPFGRMLDEYFRDPQLRRFLSILTGYLSDNPSVLTVGAMAPIFGYYFDGGYYPVGGSQALADALVASITEHGGRVRLRTAATRILVEGGRAAGVTLSRGETLRAPAIVSNVDIRRTFLDLVGREHLPAGFAQQIDAVEPSTSAFSVFLGVDYVPDVAPLTMYSTESEGSMAIAIPSRVDPSLAPAGHASITLIALVPAAEALTWDRKAPGYGDRKRARGDQLVRMAERALPGLSAHIVYRQDGTPATFARYAWTTGGSIYGPAVGQWAPAKSPVEGLVLAGAGVFPGAGVEAVVISGTLAADALRPAGDAPADRSRRTASMPADRVEAAALEELRPRSRRS